MSGIRSLYCCKCKSNVSAIFVNGSVVYPHRKDLYRKKFWMCEVCKNFVGTHNKGESNKPLGCIATVEIKKARIKIHEILDPIWKFGYLSRGQVYKKVSSVLGYEYHTAEIKSIEDAREVYKAVLEIREELKKEFLMKEGE